MFSEADNGNGSKLPLLKVIHKTIWALNIYFISIFIFRVCVLTSAITQVPFSRCTVQQPASVLVCTVHTSQYTASCLTLMIVHNRPETLFEHSNRHWWQNIKSWNFRKKIYVFHIFNVFQHLNSNLFQTYSLTKLDERKSFVIIYLSFVGFQNHFIASHILLSSREHRRQIPLYITLH